MQNDQIYKCSFMQTKIPHDADIHILYASAARLLHTLESQQQELPARHRTLGRVQTRVLIKHRFGRRRSSSGDKRTIGLKFTMLLWPTGERRGFDFGWSRCPQLGAVIAGTGLAMPATVGTRLRGGKPRNDGRGGPGSWIN